MSENQNQREDFRRVNAAGRTLGIRIVAAGFALYMLYEIVMGYIQGGPEAPSLTLLILAILLLGGGAAAVLILGYRGWKRDKAAARMTERKSSRWRRFAPRTRPTTDAAGGFRAQFSPKELLWNFFYLHFNSFPSTAPWSARLGGPGSVAALSGVGQLPRSHMLAALARDLHRPALILCADDQAAQRTQLELAAFLPQAPALLPGREFTFCDASVVSRGWEHRRLTALWQLRRGELPVLVASLEALSLRTMPPAILDAAAIALRPGMTLELDSLAARLTAAGYARTSLVEGPGPVLHPGRHCGRLRPQL